MKPLMVSGILNETNNKSYNLYRTFKDDLNAKDNLVNSISSSDCLDRQNNELSYTTLHELGKTSPFRVIAGHININSFRNKFEPLEQIIIDNIYIHSVSERNSEDAFPVSQFCVHGYSTG